MDNLNIPRQEIITTIHIADIHFGCMNPEEEYNILYRQFLSPIELINFDILSIDGDLFDRKFSANSPAIQYAISFVNQCARICASKNATLILISGTESHDAGQLRLFYDLASWEQDIHIVETPRFIYTHGIKILCIPELYGKGAGYYDNLLKEKYDMCFLHGTLVGSIPGATQENLNSKREPIFSIDSFSGCLGPIFAGHVHIHQTIQNHMYYISSPIRWRFGEEEDKGFIINVFNSYTYRYYNYFHTIQSKRYDTINISDLATNDPNEMIKKLDEMHNRGIDYIRLNCRDVPAYQLAILRKYYHEIKNPYVKFYNTTRENPTQLVDASIDAEDFNKQFADLSFLMDDKIDELMKFVMYVNYNAGSDFISLDALKKMLSGG